MNQCKSEAVDILNIKDNENNVKIMMDYSSFNEASNDSKNDNNAIDIHDIKLMMHDPRNVIKLQSEMFPICFGYLVFPKYTTSHYKSIIRSGH